MSIFRSRDPESHGYLENVTASSAPWALACALAKPRRPDKIRNSRRQSQAREGFRCRKSKTKRAGSRIRTDDLLITNQLLYQLSYAGVLPR